MPTFGTAAGHDPLWITGTDGGPSFPAVGTIFNVRNGVTAAALGTITAGTSGVWSYTSSAGVDYIEVQNASGTWVGPFMSKERQQASASFLTVDNAVALSTTAPLAPSAGGFAGTANTAMRGDARVPLPPAVPGPIWLSSGAVVPMSVPTTAMAPTTLNRAHFAPLYVRTPSRAALSCTAVSVLVTSAASAGGAIRFALYPSNTDGSINLAGKLFDSGDIAATSTGVKSAAYVATVAEGLYWGAVVQHTSATSAFMQGDHRMWFPDGVTNSGAMQTFAIQNSVTGALPTTGSIIPGGDGAPLLFFTVA